MLCKRNFRRRLISTLIVMSLLNAAIAYATVQTFNGTGQYLMTEETLDFAKKEAEREAQLKILEEVCTYVKMHATMIDNELDDDEVITTGAGVLHVTDTNYSIEEDADGLLVKAFVTAKIDVDELEKLLERETKARLSKT